MYSVPPDVDVRGADMTFGMYINSQKAGDASVPQGRFVRLAALLDPSSAYVVTVVAQGAGFFDVDDYAFFPKVNQFDPESGLYLVSIVDYLRSQTLQFDSIGYYRYYPFPGASIDLMPPSKADSATSPLAITMAAQSVRNLAPLGER